MNEEERKIEEEKMAVWKGKEVPQKIPASGSGGRQKPEAEDACFRGGNLPLTFDLLPVAVGA